MAWYVLLIVAVALERLAELVVSQRNLSWSRARGGVEFGARHYPLMVSLHTGLLAGCLVEAIAAELLVGCVVADRPGDYDRQWRQMSRRYRLLTAALVKASAYAPVRSRIVPAATALPTIFAGIVYQYD